MADTPRSAPRLTEGHKESLTASDIFFGGFCVFMALIAGVGWLQGDLGWHSAIVIFGFMVANAVISQVSFRARNPYPVEIARAIAGAFLAPAAFVLVDGPLYPWWPGFLIMCLGGAINIGLLTGNPTWGRALVVYYLGLLAVTTLVFVEEPDWYQFALNGGVIAMVGLMFAQIMSLLGQSLHKVHERSMELQQARDALFAEVEVAHEIQKLLLPTDPRLTDSVVRGRMVPAAEVGGDYYDVIDMHGRRAFLAIGDVSGHGVTSGLTMMMARSILLGVLEANPSLSLPEVYRALNRALHENLERMQVSMYMTFALLEYKGDGRYVAVGRHLPLLVYRKATGSIEEIELQGMWLGVLDDFEPERVPETTFQLGTGDLMVMYTDGIIEHFRDREMFGFERLKAIVKGKALAGPDAIINGVLAELESFAPDVEDDVTMLVVDHTGRSVAAG